ARIVAGDTRLAPVLITIARVADAAAAALATWNLRQLPFVPRHLLAPSSGCPWASTASLRWASYVAQCIEGDAFWRLPTATTVITDLLMAYYPPTFGKKAMKCKSRVHRSLRGREEIHRQVRARKERGGQLEAAGTRLGNRGARCGSRQRRGG